MNDNFKPNYIKCPGCKNILDLSFVDKSCPNPLCGFNFAGLDAYLSKNDEELRKIFLSVYKDRESREYKLVITAIKYNMGNYLAHFIECNWGAHYNTLYKDFILRFLDDLNVLKIVLKSDVIQASKSDTIKDGGNTAISKNGYKMFWDLYCRLKKATSTAEIRSFLITEFPKFHRRHYRELSEKLNEKIKEKGNKPKQKSKLF